MYLASASQGCRRARVTTTTGSRSRDIDRSNVRERRVSRMTSRSSAEDLGVRPKVGASGRQTPTEVLCRATVTLGGDDRSGGAPTSEASLLAQGPHESGERASLDSSRLSDVSIAGGRVTPPAKSQEDSAGRNATTQGLESLVFPAGADAPLASADIPIPPKATAQQPRVVGKRVDALVVAFAVEPPPPFRDELIERQSIADEAGIAQLTVAGLFFAMKRSRRRDAVSFENADVRGVFDERAAGNWKLELTVRATYLATHRLEESIALVKRIASGFGIVTAIRLRRFDLAVDSIGFPLAHDDIRRFVTQRAKVSAFAPEAKDLDIPDRAGFKPAVIAHHGSRLQVTGFSIAQGNPLMARIYDKTEELAVQGNEEKRSIESTIWRANGWDGIAGVTRIEFQHRGVYLDEIDLRNVDDLADKLDAVWQSDVHWLRLVVPTAATRLRRCELDPRWQAVSNVIFRHTAAPIPRRRVRGGATPEHVIGATRSRLAASGQLKAIKLGTTEDGELLDEHSFAYRMSDDEARAWLREYSLSLFGRAGRDAWRALANGSEPQKAVERFIVKNNSTVARFSSSDDTQ